MTNARIASVLDHIGDLIEFQGANPFRVRAYRNAARTIHDAEESVAGIVADPSRNPSELRGVGKDLAAKVVELVETGSLAMLDELLEEIPESVLAILRVPGLGPKRASVLYKELGIVDLDGLRAACEAGEVRSLKGFGAKTEKTILEGLAIAAEADRRTLWVKAEETVELVLAHLRASTSVARVEPAGSYRRGRETVGDLDFLVVAADGGAEAVMEHFAQLEGITAVLLRGETKMSVRYRKGIQIDLRVVSAESFGAAWQYFTGSQAHNVVLRGMARSRGLKINEYGVFRGEDRVAGTDEEDVYAALDLSWIPPELREARQEFDQATDGRLPDLITLGDIRGDLHAHTTWTDGMDTIEAMAEEAKRLGLDYIAVTDHSQRVAIAGGLHADEFRRQWETIDALNEQIEGIHVLKGVELDILESGELDLPDDVLAEADWVVASIHFGQKQSREQTTRRMIGALENPHVSAIAHPTGRLLTRRAPYDLDLDVVLEAAAKHGKMMELNSHPMRLDLDDIACARAKSLGIPIVISTDAHNTDGLASLRHGIQQARRAGLTPSDVANTRPWSQLPSRT